MKTNFEIFGQVIHVSPVDEIRDSVKAILLHFSSSHLAVPFCDILKKHGIISWAHLRALRTDAACFPQTTSELIKALGGGEGAAYTLKHIIDAAFAQAAATPALNKPSNAALMKPITADGFAYWLSLHLPQAFPDQTTYLDAKKKLLTDNNCLHPELAFQVSDPAKNSYTWLCAFCLHDDKPKSKLLKINPPLNRHNLFKHFHNAHFNHTLLIGESSPNKKAKRAARDSVAAAPSSPSAPALARTASGTGTQSQL